MRYHKHSYRHLRKEMFRIWSYVVKYNPMMALTVQEFDIHLYSRPRNKQERKSISKLMHDKLYQHGTL